jgi:hypothetical protein
MESIEPTVKADEAAYDNAVADLMRLDPDIVFVGDPSEPCRTISMNGLPRIIKWLSKSSEAESGSKP